VKFTIKIGDEQREVKARRRDDRLYFSFGDKEYSAQLVHEDGPYFVLEVEEPREDGTVRRRRIRAASHAFGRKRQLWVNGSSLEFERVEEQTHSTSREEMGDSLASSIPAVAREILVATGDRVAAGDRLILLESMKMIIPIVAPHSGTVTAINCEEGQSIQPGVALVNLSSDQA